MTAKEFTSMEYSKRTPRSFDPALDLPPVRFGSTLLPHASCHTERGKTKREVRKVNIPAGMAEGVGRGLDELIKTTAKKRGPLPFTTDCMCNKKLTSSRLLPEKDFDQLAK
jgi:hypothetical protein